MSAPEVKDFVVTVQLSRIERQHVTCVVQATSDTEADLLGDAIVRQALYKGNELPVVHQNYQAWSIDSAKSMPREVADKPLS